MTSSATHTKKTYRDFTYDEFLVEFETKTLRWCVDQLLVLPYNLKYGSVNENFEKALRDTIRNKKSHGEVYETYTTNVYKKEEEPKGHIEHISCGGKGQTIRVFVPDGF